MNSATTNRLLELNQRFYQEFGASFAATRRRIQPGVRRALQRIPPVGNWLDLGCGSGALAAEWMRQGRQGLYLGLDFSRTLLAEAQAAVASRPQVTGLAVRFQPADLADPDWAAPLEDQSWDGVLAFAVLHHLPGHGLRLQVLRAVRRLLPPGGLFIHSEWQFQHSPRLLARCQPWAAVGLSEADLEEGDTLLDWRAPGRSGSETRPYGLRYVHLFSRPELAALAVQSGFEMIEEYESDGKEGRLGLYQVWVARELAASAGPAR